MATYTKKELENSRVEIIGTIPYEDLVIHEEIALARLAKELEVDGFRKGQVPPTTARKYIQDLAILEAMAEEALMKEYGDIIKIHAPDAIGRPDINITKIARDNPMEFKVSVTVMPTIKLPDYKKIAKDENKNKKEVVLTDEEVEKSLAELQKMRMGKNDKEDKTHVHEDGSVHDEEHNEKETTQEQHPTPALPLAEGGSEATNPRLTKEGAGGGEITLPELNDEFAQSFGDSFKTLDDLKNKIRENMLREKEMIASDSIRMAIGEKIIEGMLVELPDLLIDGEIERMAYRMESDLANSGMSLDEYAKMVNKTMDDIKVEWRPSAEKRVKLQLALDEIAKLENIILDAEQINKEVEQLKQMYKDIDPLRAKIYVEGQLKNEKTFEFLDAQ
ncbi:hypothetical protein A2903_02135 [Candidatus Nomurabacteria bacterium RIFCSPLOWO2_01_FULL_33_17]|uniref:Trigger factor n=1 Tax=Candidatus Nomurabacteria bacterium RIFCSPLOWO2_01_FULL_33_17 TaxID=1801764 RepID=A0A1F6WMX2_9BACT|nr:MAG: hypothetical protein A2903_02135 [Candidatus Nomurabacteria bacterium RIFCSPLOWO2_01_FULL_33_17]